MPRRHALAIACTLVLSAAPPAFAQDQPATTETTTETPAAPGTPAKKPAAKKAADAVELQRIEVVGIRHAIATATETKQEQSSIVEAVSSEDLGKLPDVSIAESLARLPGLTAQRVDGRAQVIAIRGMSPDFAATLLNGREQVSTGDNRGVEFDQYPSELLSGVVVYKTPDATLVGQGLSGTVDLQTVKPLNFPDRVVSMNYRFDQNRNNGLKENGNRFSFAYIDQFRDRTVGVAIGLAHLDSPQPGYQDEAWGYADGPNGTKVFGGVLGVMLSVPMLFFMGAAFLLLETKNVVQFALLFGTTWAVNAAVFAGVLLSVLAAIEVARDQVERAIGEGAGVVLDGRTGGGSAGAEYLRSTLMKPMFPSSTR